MLAGGVLLWTLNDELEVAALHFVGTEYLDCRLPIQWMSGQSRPISSLGQMGLMLIGPE